MKQSNVVRKKPDERDLAAVQHALYMATDALDIIGQEESQVGRLARSVAHHARVVASQCTLRKPTMP